MGESLSKRIRLMVRFEGRIDSSSGLVLVVDVLANRIKRSIVGMGVRARV